MKPIIEIKNLTKKFGKKLVFENLNFKIYPGDRIALLGPNGVGKSTLMEMICGLSKITSGAIIHTEGEKQFFKSLGMQFQRGIYPLGIRVRDLIYLYSKVYKIKINDKLMAEMEIKELLNQNLNDLSFGQKQRVELFILMNTELKFLILDEITSGMDIMIKFNVLTLLKQYFADNKNEVIYISHNIDEINHFCNRVVVMTSKGIIYDQALSEISDLNNTLKKFFK